MNKRLLKATYTLALILGTMMFFSSCSDDSNDIVETAWNIEEFTVNSTQWSWNSDLNRWEAVRPLDYIDDFIYEKGAVIGYIFIGTQGQDELQIQLPYIKSWLIDGEDGGQINFTETIGYEYSIVNKRVTFFIEPSDGFKDEDAKQTYNFRIVMIW